MQLSEVFHGLQNYFADLIPVLQEIARTAQEEPVDYDFWRSIYKWNDDSGGPYVSGWITALTAYVPSSEGFVMKEEFDWRRLAESSWGGYGTNKFPSHVSKVPFIWNYYENEIPMSFISGIIGVDYDEGFLAPRLGFGVIELEQ